MPTSYTTTVSVSGYTSGATYGDQLDSLEIISGSLSPYELPQPPSAKASFIGLPVVTGITQTPDWWLGKNVTFTITPQGATGTVTWSGYVQSFVCSSIDPTNKTQTIQLSLNGHTSKFATQMITGSTFDDPGITAWYSGTGFSGLNQWFAQQLYSQTWAEAPIGFQWNMVTTTWENYNQNVSGLNVIQDAWNYGSNARQNAMNFNGFDMLTTIYELYSTKANGWYWFDNKTCTLNAPSSYTNYSTITSLNAQTCVISSSQESSQDLSDVISSATVSNYDLSEVSSVYNATSANTYGQRAVDFGISYEYYKADRDYVVSQKSKAFKAPNKYLQSLTINLDLLTHVTGEWQNFYKSTKPVLLPVTNIPAAYGGNHTYMVRGVQLNLTQKHAEATLIVVPSTIYNPS